MRLPLTSNTPFVPDPIRETTTTKTKRSYFCREMCAVKFIRTLNFLGMK